MNDPEERDYPTLEDEIFGTARLPDEDPAPPAAPPAPAARSSARPAARPAARPNVRFNARAAVGGVLRSRVSWDSKQPIGCREMGLTTAGFVTFVMIDSVMMYAPFRTKDAPNLTPQMITLLLLAFGLGGMMVWHIRGAWRPVGVGMMLAWVFLTLVSAGFLTGLNP